MKLDKECVFVYVNVRVQGCVHKSTSQLKEGGNVNLNVNIAWRFSRSSLMKHNLHYSGMRLNPGRIHVAMVVNIEVLMNLLSIILNNTIVLP